MIDEGYRSEVAILTPFGKSLLIFLKTLVGAFMFMGVISW
jgi:hypothetical protein